MHLSSNEVHATPGRDSLRCHIHRRGSSAVRRIATGGAIAAALAFSACAVDSADDPETSEIQQGVAVLTVTPITWNMMGLDSNDVTKGPNVFPVGVRIANTGDVTATNPVSYTHLRAHETPE